MPGIKLLNLLAVSSIAILGSSFGPAPTNALSVDVHHVARHMAHSHDVIAKRKRASRRSTKRCKPHASSALGANPAQKTSPAQNKGGNGGGGGGGGGNTPPAGSASGPKFGLAWPNGDDQSLRQYGKPGTYIYTWSPFIPNLAKELGMTAVPMLWGRNQVGDFQRLVHKGYANHVLGFNEPNQHGQSDMSPQEGASLWKQYIEPLQYQGYELISPATTSAPSGLTWVKDMLNACNGGCTFHAVAIHYYDVNPDDFIAYIKRFHDAFGKPIWATEYACQNFNGGAQCSRDETFNFHQRITSFMDQNDWVHKYFPFGIMHDMQGVNGFNQLMSGNGGPTALGHMYTG